MLKPKTPEDETHKITEENAAAEVWGDDEYRFHGQRPDESILHITNQHPIVLWRVVLWSLLIFAVLWVWIALFEGQMRPWGIGVAIVLLAAMWGYNLYAYFNGMCILTNQRIVYVIQKGFFYRRISEAELNRIQDVSSDVKGMLHTIFNVGDVTIRTASKDSLLIVKNIPAPYDLQQAIVRTLKDTN